MEPFCRGLVFSNEHISSQYSRSEVVLTFFERSPLDQVLKNDNVHKIQPSFQSPVKISGKSYREGQEGKCSCGQRWFSQNPASALPAWLGTHTSHPWDPERPFTRMLIIVGESLLTTSSCKLFSNSLHTLSLLQRELFSI